MKKIYIILLKFFLNVHTYAYKIVTILSIKAYGTHPKHEIINYKKWFESRVNENDVVLDIGSKTGEMAFYLSKKCKKVYGIEIEKSTFTLAENRYKKSNLRFILGDATKYNYNKFIKDKISVITMSNVLEHIENREVFLKMLTNQINSNQKVKILIRVPSIEREWVAPLKKKLGVVWKLDHTHFTEYTKSQLNNELKTIGYKNTELDTKWGEIYSVYMPI
jgi:SAM-dependent methyltransferase